MSEQEPVIQQRAQSPPGSIPRNRQSLIMVAVAVVIVLAVIFSGSTEPQPKAGQNLPAMNVHTPSKTEIERYTKALRMEEERLRQAQADASRSRAAFQQQVNTGMQGGIPGEAAIAPNGQPYYPTPGYVQQVPPSDPIQQDKQKREYASLFASNMALSLRKEPLPDPKIAQRDGAENDSNNNARPSVVAKSTPGDLPERISPNENFAPKTEARPQPSVDGHPLFEGTILEAVLTNRLEGSFAGPVNCQVTTDVYSHDRQHLLIPKGSRVLGEARRVEDRDQQRLAVLFHRLILPDGYSVSLDRLPALDQTGATALKDKVNKHYLSTFGTSIALGLFAGFSLYGTSGVLTADGSDMYRQGVASQVGRDATRILDRWLNRLPEIQVREGTRVKIWLASDISMPAYHQHLSTPAL